MRTVLTVNPSGDKDPASGADIVHVSADRSPFNIPLAGQSKPVVLSAQQLPDWTAVGGVRLRGLWVRDALYQHQGVATLLGQLSQVPNGQIHPIFVRLRDGNAEMISWETLCDSQDQFLALDSRWPVGRISDPMATAHRPSPVFRLPVKILAAISAIGVPNQQKEWKVLLTALDRARKNGLDLEALVLIGDSSWRPEVEAAIAAQRPWLRVSHVEKTGARVVQEITEWQPNIVHFFCHGYSGMAGQALELATNTDYQTGATTGSVRIAARNLEDLGQNLANPWLMTLNCCSGAEAASDLQSMAHAVVASGFPAAVGMLEPVDATDAHEFTRAFYSTLFSQLRQVRTALQGKARVPFEWAGAMYDARSAICQLHQHDAPSAREWALPVLYVRGMDPLNFENPPADSEMVASGYRLRARTLAEWLRGPGATMTAEQRREIMKVTLHDIPPAYWPNDDGTFRDG